MSSDRADEAHTAEDPPGEEHIAAWLEANPDFFERHPDLVAKLRIPHGVAGTRSLVEHQLGVMRGQLETERRRLSHLITRAREYETLAGRLHALVLQLIAAPDLKRLTAVLREALCKELKAEAVTLKLFEVPPGPESADPLISAFRDFVDRPHALCGPLETERNQVLFGDRTKAIASAALVPIRGERRAGVLAIGSSDPQRFRPEMGTEFLDRLGEVVSQRLRVMGDGEA